MSWFVYVVRFEDAETRNRMVDDLQAVGVPSRPYFTPIHLQPFYQHMGWKRGDLPQTELAGDTSLALPFSSVMTEDEVDYVCERIQQALR
jgi:dTDP-4-amino-4,6-dideoxygalactose transaminase